MTTALTFSVTEFEAECLDILDRLGSGTLDRVEVTKHGRIIAILTPPHSPDADDLFGCLKTQTVIPDGFDLTAPIVDNYGSSALVC